jgi:hypothetical protein
MNRIVLKTLTIPLLFLIVSCNKARVSKQEVAAVDSVLAFYGGQCVRAKGYKIENDEKETYFELEMSKSKTLDTYEDFLGMAASNVAYLFYKNLGDDKKNIHTSELNLYFPTVRLKNTNFPLRT